MFPQTQPVSSTREPIGKAASRPVQIAAGGELPSDPRTSAGASGPGASTPGNSGSIPLQALAVLTAPREMSGDLSSDSSSGQDTPIFRSSSRPGRLPVSAAEPAASRRKARELSLELIGVLRTMKRHKAIGEAALIAGMFAAEGRRLYDEQLAGGSDATGLRAAMASPGAPGPSSSTALPPGNTPGRTPQKSGAPVVPVDPAVPADPAGSVDPGRHAGRGPARVRKPKAPRTPRAARTPVPQRTLQPRTLSEPAWADILKMGQPHHPGQRSLDVQLLDILRYPQGVVVPVEQLSRCLPEGEEAPVLEALLDLRVMAPVPDQSGMLIRTGTDVPLIDLLRQVSRTSRRRQETAQALLNLAVPGPVDEIAPDVSHAVPANAREGDPAAEPPPAPPQATAAPVKRKRGRPPTDRRLLTGAG